MNNYSLSDWSEKKNLLILKSATKPFNVLLACTHPLITEFADDLN